MLLFCIPVDHHSRRLQSSRDRFSLVTPAAFSIVIKGNLFSLLDSPQDRMFCYSSIHTDTSRPRYAYKKMAFSPVDENAIAIIYMPDFILFPFV
jgi:hypothetical protein